MTVITRNVVFGDMFSPSVETRLMSMNVSVALDRNANKSFNVSVLSVVVAFIMRGVDVIMIWMQDIISPMINGVHIFTSAADIDIPII